MMALGIAFFLGMLAGVILAIALEELLGEKQEK